MLIDPFEHKGANAVAAESGYSAPYLYLLQDDIQSSSRLQPTVYTKRKVAAIDRAIHAGYGQGRGDAFQPWIRIRRNFSSPTSYQVFDSVGIQARNHHFLSTLEFHTALICSYLGASELRECLPLWPFDHPHPDSGLNEETDTQLGLATGLIEIARDAGIEHGFFVGTKVPYIASIDLMFRVRQKQNWRLVGISCKPGEITARSPRAQERIQLDRLYCLSVGARHVHEDGESLNPELLKQLRWIRPMVSEIRTHQRTSRLQDYAAHFDEYAIERCVSDAAITAGRGTGLNHEDAFMFFRLGIWLHIIDVDLTQRIQMRSQVKRGSAQLLQKMKLHYWGHDHE